MAAVSHDAGAVSVLLDALDAQDYDVHFHAGNYTIDARSLKELRGLLKKMDERF